MQRTILASQSPRRRELLESMGLAFTVVPSDFDEQLDHSRPAAEVAKELALGKALDVAKAHPQALVIGADTIVAVDGHQLGKPKDRQEAFIMLRRLAGRSHEVATGVALVCQAKEFQKVAADKTIVHFKPFNQALFSAYLDTNDYADKAGAYGIQSGAAPLIDHIEGDYNTIVGLPTDLLATMLPPSALKATKEKPEWVLAQAEADIASGNLSGPFQTPQDLYDHLDKLSR